MAASLPPPRPPAHSLVPRRAAHARAGALFTFTLTRAVALAMALGLALAGAAHAATATDSAGNDGYTRVPATEDGIGKAYMGRQIARVMGFEAAAWLERAERAREEGTGLLLPDLGLRAGMNVADIGAGTGYYSRRIAPKLLPGGRLYAVDVQPEMLAQLRQGAAAAGIANIEPVLASRTATNLPAASIDLALMVDVYHELEFPREVLASIVRALRPGGRVAFVEYRAEDPAVPIKRLHKMSAQQVQREAEAAGLRLLRTRERLPWQHVLIFERRAD